MADEAPPKKKSKLKWIILIVLLLAIGGGGAAAWFLFLQDMILPPSDEAQQQPAQVEKAPEQQNGIEVPLATFTTNLADPLGKRFIRLTVTLRVADQKVEADLAARSARIRDSIILLLGSKTYADIARTESKLLLKNEMMERLTTILGPGKVYDVYITDLVVQ